MKRPFQRKIIIIMTNVGLFFIGMVCLVRNLSLILHSKKKSFMKKHPVLIIMMTLLCTFLLLFENKFLFDA